ncbi:hypothetical protein RvY_15944 [Ramazzottius varieornatus]|uniref:Uncharacterized protein n=1 Tax=Ramazzottius varieornatus TaxID=947166 RepID=A0A1D1VXR7_RAMVA|nr:hypothetical protein RvY_15944 [Ramazzottius varieornatus]
MFGGMIGASASYQMSVLTTGFPMGFPLGPPFGFSLGPSAATQPAVPSVSPGAPAIQPSSLRISQASSYPASAVTNSLVGTGRPDVKISLGSIGPPHKAFDHRRLGNQPPHHCNSKVGATVGVAVLTATLTDAAVVMGAAMALDGAVDAAVDVAATREADVIVTDNGETAPGTA